VEEAGFKYLVHRLLAADDRVRAMIEREAIGTIAPPRTELELAWREGRRSIAAELMSLFHEVEDERTRVG
jgi:hypothetical protein